MNINKEIKKSIKSQQIETGDKIKAFLRGDCAYIEGTVIDVLEDSFWINDAYKYTMTLVEYKLGSGKLFFKDILSLEQQTKKGKYYLEVTYDGLYIEHYRIGEEIEFTSFVGDQKCTIEEIDRSYIKYTKDNIEYEININSIIRINNKRFRTIEILRGGNI